MIIAFILLFMFYGLPMMVVMLSAYLTERKKMFSESNKFLMFCPIINFVFANLFVVSYVFYRLDKYQENDIFRE